MSNRETFVPLGLVDLIQGKVNSKREQLDDLEGRLHSALDAKRDVASDYSRQLQDTIKHNESIWQAGYDEGYKAGRDSEMQASEKRDRDLLEEHGIDVDGFCDKMVKKIQDYDDIDCHPDYDAKTDSIKDHEQDSDWDKEKRRIWNEAKTNPSYKDHEQDIDEDEPDQYPVNYGGTK